MCFCWIELLFMGYRAVHVGTSKERLTLSNFYLNELDNPPDINKHKSTEVKISAPFLHLTGRVVKV